MIEPREFEWSLRLCDGRYLRKCRGVEWQDAAKAAGIDPAEVRRALPTKAILTEAEKAIKTAKFAKLQKKSLEGSHG